MAGKLGEPGGMNSEINITPMVDIMLVLLIIFMVTAPMMDKDKDKRKVDMDLPVTQENDNRIDPEQTDKLILEIDRNLVVRLGEEVIVDCQQGLKSVEKKRFEPSGWQYAAVPRAPLACPRRVILPLQTQADWEAAAPLASVAQPKQNRQ